MGYHNNQAWRHNTQGSKYFTLQVIKDLPEGQVQLIKQSAVENDGARLFLKAIQCGVDVRPPARLEKNV